VLRDVSLFVDAFDGSASPLDDGPMNGNEWVKLGDHVVELADAPGASDLDEHVRLDGKAFASWISHALGRNTFLREDSVFGGLSDAMVEQGVGWCARCQVFALHRSDATCPEAWVGPRPTLNMAPGGPVTCVFEGCPAGTFADVNTQVCAPPCPVGQQFDGVLLTCVDSGGIDTTPGGGP
jgi:hypothetical protein